MDRFLWSLTLSQCFCRGSKAFISKSVQFRRAFMNVPYCCCTIQTNNKTRQDNSSLAHKDIILNSYERVFRLMGYIPCTKCNYQY